MNKEKETLFIATAQTRDIALQATINHGGAAVVIDSSTTSLASLGINWTAEQVSWQYDQSSFISYSDFHEAMAKTGIFKISSHLPADVYCINESCSSTTITGVIDNIIFRLNDDNSGFAPVKIVG
jgi:hypothetical protein